MQGENLDIVYQINDLVSWQFWALFGIILEITGFGLMTFRWGKHPKMEQYLKWIDGHEALVSEWRAGMTLMRMKKARESKKWYTMLPWSYMYIDDVEKNRAEKYSDKYNAVVRYQEVPNRFRLKWTFQTKVVSILPVIVGLGFQGMQLIKF